MLLKKLNLLIKNQRIMKKIFLFCAAMLVAFAANAATINVNPGNDALIAALQSAANGDVLVLADGVYNEYSNYIDFNKTIEVKAADGAKPVVNVGCYIKVQGGSTVKISGIKFDGTEQGHNGNSYSHFIRVYDNAVNNTLILDGCEICNTKANIALRVEADKYLNSLQINNCYFHDGTNCAINIAKSGGANHACPRIEINNSTFANYIGLDNGIIAINSKDGGLAADPANDVEVKMDHCTFYHNTMKTETSTWGCLDVRKSANVVVSNCIFANPATVATGTFAERATQLYGGSISNCLLFNTPNHRTDAITPANPLKDVDPKFVYAEKGDYTLFKNSPATNYGTDGLTLGDARWYPKKVAMKGSWDEWAKQLVFEDATDGLTATAKMHLDKNMTPGYEFKMLNGGEWCVNEGFWFTHDGNKKADNVVPQVGDGNPMVLKAYKGDYTFTWTYATKSLEVTFPSADTKYYLHGSFNGWVDIEMTENAGILSATAALEADKNDYQFKIYKLDYLEEKTWYGAEDEINMMTKDNCTNWQLSDDQMDNWDIYLTSAKAGDYKFSFNPADKKLNVIYPSGTGINNVEMGEKAVKVIENGQLYIIKNGVKINALGTVVK